MKQRGKLFYNQDIDRIDIFFDSGETYGGLHCGEGFEAKIDGYYELVSIEKAEKWYIPRHKGKRQTGEKKAEAKAAEELKEIEQTEKVFIDGGTITDAKLIVKIADRLGVNIPIRTRGWILNSLVECTISNSGGLSCRYWKSKTGKGSQKVYDVLVGIRRALQNLKTA